MYSAAHIDFETRSTTDLKKAGIARYFEDPNTGTWGFAWRMDHGPVRQWRPDYPDPVELLQHVAAGGRVIAHNAAFERYAWNKMLRTKYVPHWPEMHIGQQDCTQARAASCAFPQSLDNLGDALNLDMRKDREGHAVMQKQMRPRRIEPDGRIVWWDDPELTDRNMAYCEQDVRTETEADDMLPQLSPRWREVWELDQKINDRGVHFDRDAVNVFVDLVDIAKKEADRSMRVLTGRTVPKCTNVGKMVEWLQGRGINTQTLKKGDQDDLLYIADTRNDKTAREVIELRKSSSKTSTAKYAAMTKCICADSRIRNLLNFHGASTGRWAGRLVQPQNFPRVDPDDEILAAKIEWLHELVDAKLAPKDVFDAIELIHGPAEPMQIMSKALRSVVRAPKGKKLVGGDFSNIEGRVNAWLGNEQWKLDAFVEYDLGIGPDLYKLAYSKSFGEPVEKIGKGHKRQIGKVQELALGYQGSVGAYMQMGDTYGVNPYDLTWPVYSNVDPKQWDATAARYESATNKSGLQLNEWTAIKIIVDNWRGAHTGIVQSWWDYQDAAIQAVNAPGNVVSANTAGNMQARVSYYSDGACLWCILPSGRMLCYASPSIESEKHVYTDKYTGELRETIRHKVAYWGVDSITKQWRKQYLYGGHQCENIVQAVACDILVDSMFRLEARGYPLILTVHDENLAEVDEDSELDDVEFSRVMSEIDPIYEGLPIAVSAWQGERWTK